MAGIADAVLKPIIGVLTGYNSHKHGFDHDWQWLTHYPWSEVSTRTDVCQGYGVMEVGTKVVK
jgi:hypothetical protein